MRRVTIFIALAVLSFSSFSSTLEMKKNGKAFKTVPLEEIKSGKTLGLKAKQIHLYNAWRGYSKTYEGYELYSILNLVYGENWKKAQTIIFKATDGYTMGVNIKKMLKASKKKVGLIAYKEKGKEGFTPVRKGERTVNPGPLYLVWSNFNESDKATHGDSLKWPYQLQTIDITY